jgi:hypothetical protein
MKTYNVFLRCVLYAAMRDQASMRVSFLGIKAGSDVEAGSVARDHMATPHHWEISLIKEVT